MVKQDNILVTGGLGFLGSHLTEKLAADGAKVTVVDNRLSNVVESFDYDVQVVVSDLVDFLPIGDYDVIYHLAGMVGPVGILSHAGSIGFDTMKSADYVVGMALDMDALLVFVSTSELYGRPGRFAENDIKVISGKPEVRTEYAVGKLLSEIVIQNTARANQLKYHIVRPFNIAGPRQRSIGGFVIPRFVEAAVAGLPITVYGDGSQVRAFTHVLDTVSALCLLKEVAESGVWNVGNEANLTTILELARLVKHVTGSQSPVTFIDPVVEHGALYAEAPDKVPDSTKINKHLGWQPTRSLIDIVKDVIEFMGVM